MSFSCCDSVASPQANGLGIGLSTPGSSLGTTIKNLRRKRNGAAGNGLGTTMRYLQRTTVAGSRLAATIK
jgi:hypothetical protein